MNYVNLAKTVINKVINTYHSHKKTFSTFIILGIGTTGIYGGIFSIFWYGLHINHLFSVSIAFISAATYQFTANRHITFKGEGVEIKLDIFRYSFLLLLNYLLSVVIMQFCVEFIHSPMTGIILTTIVNTITGYLFFRFWIFKPTLPA